MERGISRNFHFWVVLDDAASCMKHMINMLALIRCNDQYVGQ
jgi:hypothetical protein